MLSPRWCLQCSSEACLMQGLCSWGPTAGSVFWAGRLFCMNQYMLCRETPGTAAAVMNYRRFLSRSGQSDSSLLMVSLGKLPGDEQEDHATTFSPGMANAFSASPVLFHQRIWRSFANLQLVLGRPWHLHAHCLCDRAARLETLVTPPLETLVISHVGVWK